MSKLTEKTIVEKNTLLKQLEIARKKGYAIDYGESYDEFTGVAAPIFNHFGKADYAISVAGPTNRLSKEKLEAIGIVLVEFTKEISALIGR